MTSSSYDNIKNPIRKKVFLTRDKPPAMLVELHEPIAKDLGIDQGCSLEQIPMRDGIFLRVSHDVSERATRENDTNPRAQDDPQELASKNNEEWSSAYISDRLYLEMCSTEKEVVMHDWMRREDKVKKYFAEAAKYAQRSSAGNFEGRNTKYRPIFHLDLNDFSPELKANLLERLKTSKESIHRVVEDAVFRIFLARHRMIFHQHIEAEGLRWRFD